MAGSDAAGNAQRIEEVFAGEASPLANAICANAACALALADRVEDFREGYELARTTLASGQALAKLREAQAFASQEACHDVAV